MTIHECLVRLDNLKHNTYLDVEKRQWLSQLDGRIRTELLDTHADGPEEPFPGYDAATPGDQELLVEPPYDEIYIRYLEAMLDYHNGEIEKYNNSSQLFQAAWDAYARFYNRSHMPLGQKWQFG